VTPAPRHPSTNRRQTSNAADAVAVALALAVLAGFVVHECTTSEAACDIVRRRSFLAIPATVAFAGAATFLRGVTPAGAIAGWAIALVLWQSAGSGAFLALISLFALTWFATRFGYARKLAAGVAEPRRGRSAVQVVANVGVAAVAAAFGGVPGAIACVAALAEAAADTVSSEVGQATSNRARLIPSFAIVPAGTDGAVSLAGTLAGIAAAAAVAGIALAAAMISARVALWATVAGVLGMLFDSLLGATLERRGWLNNDAVNALSTAFAAVIAVAGTLWRP
jgi:uncharacterized protein (TIGR00297 family)